MLDVSVALGSQHSREKRRWGAPCVFAVGSFIMWLWYADSELASSVPDSGANIPHQVGSSLLLFWFLGWVDGIIAKNNLASYTLLRTVELRVIVQMLDDGSATTVTCVDRWPRAFACDIPDRRQQRPVTYYHILIADAVHPLHSSLTVDTTYQTTLVFAISRRLATGVWA